MRCPPQTYLIALMTLFPSAIIGCDSQSLTEESKYPSEKTQTASLYGRMRHAATPPEKDIQQTLFAHIGEVQTDEGIFHVAVQRLILTGMLSPRGQPAYLMLFDSEAHLVAQ